MAEIHNEKQRMPLIIPRGADRVWLNTVDEAGTKKQMVPFDASLMDAHEVSKLVNGRSSNPNVPEVQERVAPTPQQGSLF